MEVLRYIRRYANARHHTKFLSAVKGDCVKAGIPIGTSNLEFMYASELENLRRARPVKSFYEKGTKHERRKEKFSGEAWHEKAH